MKKGDLGEPHHGFYHHADGTSWQCAWYLPYREERRPPTAVYLRPADEGAGEHTHEASVEVAPADFTPPLLAHSFPFRPRNAGSFTVVFPG